MFLSTVVPSSMFDPNQNLSMNPYKFSFPYNFVRGRNIIVNVNSCHSLQGVSGAFEGYLVNNYPLGFLNRLNIVIPDNVTSFTSNMTVGFLATENNTTYTWQHVVQINCDILNNIITFTPLSTSGVPNPSIAGSATPKFTIATLITITTILDSI